MNRQTKAKQMMNELAIIESDQQIQHGNNLNNHYFLPMDIEQYIINPLEYNFHYEDSQCQQVPVELYDCSSENESSQTYPGVDQIIESIGHQQNFVDRPVPQILQEAFQNYGLKQEDIMDFTRKIRKTKNVLKRQRAKCRVFTSNKSIISDKRTMIYDESSTEKDTEVGKQIKKQRNRVSAQVSRDRKKHYVRNLEQKNKELTLEVQNLRTENEKLKQLASQKKQSAGVTTNKLNNQGNKLKRLLVLLGIAFFIYILQDIFNSKAVSSIKGQKTNKETQEQFVKKNVIFQSNIVVEEIKNQINDIEQCQQQISFEADPSTQKITFGEIKQKVLKKLTQIKKKLKQLMLPRGLASFIMASKNDLTY